VVRPELLALVLLDGEVVDAHELDPGLDQVARGVRRQIDEVLLELRAAQLPGHARLQEHADIVAQVEGLQVGPVHLVAGRNRHYPGLAHEDLEREMIHGGPVGEEVVGRVHVRPGVSAQGDAGHVVGLAIGDPMGELHLEGRVPRKSRQRGRQRNADVEDLVHSSGGPAGTSDQRFIA
jgi:hypothetical protein